MGAWIPSQGVPPPLLQIPVSRVKFGPLGHLIHAFVRVGLEQKRFGQG